MSTRSRHSEAWAESGLGSFRQLPPPQQDHLVAEKGRGPANDVAHEPKARVAEGADPT